MVSSLSVEEQNKGPCSHHWVCDGPGGPESDAYCKKCGVTRKFANSVREFEFQGPPCLPAVSPPRLVITEDIEGIGETVPAPRPGKICQHNWEVSEADERDICHQKCRNCQLEIWCDSKGRLYDHAGNLLTNQSHRVHGGRSRMRKAKYDDNWPQILQRLDELGSIGALAREMGITYSTCQGILSKRGVDVEKYKRKPAATAAISAPVAADPIDFVSSIPIEELLSAGAPSKGPTVLETLMRVDALLSSLGAQEPQRGLPKTLVALLEMLPNLPPEKRGQWKVVFSAAFDLEYEP